MAETKQGIIKENLIVYGNNSNDFFSWECLATGNSAFAYFLKAVYIICVLVPNFRQEINSKILIDNLLVIK